MSKISMWSQGARLAFVFGLVLGLAAPAVAGSVYSWTTDDGVMAFTDDAKRIPGRYRIRAQQREFESLDGFERFTKVERPAAVSARRAASALPAVSAAPPSGTLVAQEGYGTILDLGDIKLDIGSLPKQGPIVIEQVRMRQAGSDATRTVKVVRQGDRVIAVIKPTPNETDPSFVPSEAEFD